MDTPAKRIGRPPKLQADDATLRLIRECAGHMCTIREAAAFLAVSHGTLETFLGTNKRAAEAWDSGKNLGRASIRRQQFVHSKRHAGMSMFLGKVYLDQRENCQIQLGGILGAPPIGVEHSVERGLTALLESARRENEKREVKKLRNAESIRLLPDGNGESNRHLPESLTQSAGNAVAPTPVPTEAPPAAEPLAATIPAAIPADPAHAAPSAACEAIQADPPRPTPPPRPAGAHAPKAPPPPPPHPMAGLMGAGRIRSEDAVETGGVPRVISNEAVMAEARRLGLRGQVSANELNEIRKKLAGEPYQPTYAEVCERAGATMRWRLPLFRPRN